MWFADDCPHKFHSLISADDTWKNIPIFDSDLVDCLISESDPEIPADLARVINTAFETPSFNPFGMFRLNHSAATSPLNAIQLVPPGIDFMNSEEKFLFNHYVNYVAVVMMPFDHPKNPWKSSYPARALFCSSATQKSLFSALLAQTAFNLAHLSPMKSHYMVMASKYYSLAMAQLMGMLNAEEKLNADVLATIMTLMMAEVRFYILDQESSNGSRFTADNPKIGDFTSKVHGIWFANPWRRDHGRIQILLAHLYRVFT